MVYTEEDAGTTAAARIHFTARLVGSPRVRLSAPSCSQGLKDIRARRREGGRAVAAAAAAGEASGGPPGSYPGADGARPWPFQARKTRFQASCWHSDGTCLARVHAA